MNLCVMGIYLINEVIDKRIYFGRIQNKYISKCFCLPLRLCEPHVKKRLNISAF
jgi:hypothetical protein